MTKQPNGAIFKRIRFVIVVHCGHGERWDRVYILPFSPERFFRWRCYQDYSGGIATDLFVHLCTTIHFLMDAKAPSRVTAMGELYRWKESRDVPDTLNAILEYPEGFTVNLSSSFNNEMQAEAGFQVLGTEGSLTDSTRDL